MYQYSNFSLRIKNTVTNEIFPDGEMDEFGAYTQRYLDYMDWRNQENGAEMLEFFPDEEIDYNFSISLRQEYLNYDQRRNEGIEYVKNNRAILRTRKNYSRITNQEFVDATSALIDVRTQLTQGDWETALNLLEGQTSLIPQQIYDEMHAFISAYVELSYDPQNLNSNILNEVSDIVGNRPNDR